MVDFGSHTMHLLGTDRASEHEKQAGSILPDNLTPRSAMHHNTGQFLIHSPCALQVKFSSDQSAIGSMISMETETVEFSSPVNVSEA